MCHKNALLWKLSYSFYEILIGKTDQHKYSFYTSNVKQYIENV